MELVLRPDLGVAVYPFFGALALWTDFRREAELPFIFTFLASLVGILVAVRCPHAAQKAAVMVEVGGLWALDWGISLYRNRDLADQRDALAKRLALDAGIRDDERDSKYYQAYQETVGGQIRLRRDLAETARAFGRITDSREVYRRLVDILSQRFPEARVSVLADAAADPLVVLAARRQGPVLVKDCAVQEWPAGAPACGCGMALAVKVMRQPAGYLKLEAARPGAFAPDDLRTADLFATMAALSLENIQLYEHVHQAAVHDPLTQLFSHRAFEARLREELLRAGRGQTPLSFILCDVDHFKSYNDRYGHQAGDQLLRTLAAIIAAFARPVDFPARYGGEEFCLILPNMAHAEAVALAESMRRRVGEEPFVFQGNKTGATMSFGVSSFPADATTASQIVRIADERLYQAKNAGRDRVVG
ncbi:MAG: sensor domain-containing diguanylate cyclase [Elusimicrobia bacterium]|nr:sensor domain-containing diguanylate cyclase [Elusimicrobiota bacterium]